MSEKEFTYAHRDTSSPERVSRTAGLNRVKLSDGVASLRKSANEREVPVADDETLGFLLTLARAVNAESILEVGCAEGVTSLALLEECGGAHLTAIERDGNFYAAAEGNLKEHADRVTLLLGDANELLPTLGDCAYDFIFLDCAKVQYVKLLPHLKRVLKAGGVLLADDVLLYGWVNGEVETPKKRKMLVEHIREYLTAVTNDGELRTSVLDIGNGLALSVKK